MSRNCFDLFGRPAPRGEGPRPRPRSPSRAVTLGLVLLGGLAACSQSSSDQVTSPIALGMTSKMAAYYSSQQTSIYQVQLPVQLPVRRPTSADLQGLGPKPKGTPYPRAPFLTADDESVEVHYTLSNVDSQDHVVWLLIDPWNEFVRWSPGATLTDQGAETLPNWGYDQAFIVPAKQRIEGTLTPDDMHEIAIKLASAENVLASPQAQAAMQADAGPSSTSFDPAGLVNNIFNPQNRSNGNDPLYTPWIPPVVAGVTGFDLGLRTYGDAANVAVEITIDVQDLNGNRFVTAGSGAATIGMPPTTLRPPGAM